MKEVISYEEFNGLCDISRYPYGNISGNDLMDIYKYLKDKKVKDYITVKEASKSFLFQTLSRPYYYSDYEKVHIDFLSSNYISSEMKNIILKAIERKCSSEVKELLTNDIHFNDFTCSDIYKVYNEFNKYTKYGFTNEKMAFEDYLFFLDGAGVVDFIKSTNNEQQLALSIIPRSGIDPSIYYPTNELRESDFNERNLLSVYDKYNKYFPDKKEEFFDFVNSINYLTENNFLENYYIFVNNGFNSSMPYIEDNKWYTYLDKEHQNMKDIINDNIHIRFNVGVRERENVLKIKQF